MQRIRASITYSASGSPGVITLYTRSTGSENSGTATLTSDRLKNALTAGVALFPSSMHFTGDGYVDTMDPATGAITGSDSVTAWTVTGTSSDVYLPPASAIVLSWKTAAVIAGRRVAGRTFLSPLWQGDVEANGSPGATQMTAANAVAAAWVDNGLTSTFAVVWHRPVGGTGGTAEDITAHSVRDKFAVLRSRRD